ncbi:MAG: helix-turn-helix domain-containing protein [SAR324 cluster bacterium]|nr:helix-turn-helix domain-containing protein [SAR324 cluster bacterium]
MRNKPELTSNSGKFNLRYIFGMKLRSFRQEKGFGLKQLAALTGLSASYINEIKRGKSIQKQKK